MIDETGREVRIFPDLHALSHAAADTVRVLARKAVSDHGRFTAALSGGSTPKELYTLLAERPYRDQIPWKRVHLFWADERCVPPEHVDSNFRLVQEPLLSRVAIPEENVHRIKGERGPDRAASEYEQELKAFFGEDGFPVMDLIILGVGEDGHTASLFPGSPLIGERDRLAAPVPSGNHEHERVTLTLPVIDHARQVLFLASGAAKQNVIRSLLADGNPDGLPAGLVRSAMGSSAWYLDKAAASHLRQRDDHG